ncbi:MAG: TIGR01459 family HAD-type hydrolase [Pseudomonadota bacterium]
MRSAEAFAAYEAVRHRLPPAADGGRAEPVDTLADLADRFDVFLLDAFGVLNIGEQAIPGVVERVADLQARGKRCLVVTNAAGAPHAALLTRYARLGYAFAASDVISSRETLLTALRQEPAAKWGLMAARRFGTEDLQGIDVTFLDDSANAYAAADAFLLLGSAEWTERRQERLEAALRARARPVWVGNPDIVAPREHGFSIEPGHFAHRLAEATGLAPRFFGKPFQNIYDLAFARLGPVDRSRVVMVGDSLHTDVLGGQTAGVATALVTAHGFFAQTDVASAMRRAQISPDFLLRQP